VKLPIRFVSSLSTFVTSCLGWKRYGIKVADDEKEFDSKWGEWNAAYHGTQGEYANDILLSGLKVSLKGCYYTKSEPRVYTSPSIEYSAHPRYAYPWQKLDANGRKIWYQLVFQCRVNPKSISSVKPETLLKNECEESVVIDPNFSNAELEWIILGKKQDVEFIKDDIICYGLMLRKSHVDPAELPAAKWWPSSHHHDTYLKKKPAE
jgi:hypothetical protein